jgi:AraC-like DNA-binding protein
MKSVLLLDNLGTSHSPLVRRFREQVGIGPKSFASLVRLRRLLPLLSSWQGNLTDLSFQMGYHDQAHFIHEFRRMTGLSPKQYQSRDRWTESLIQWD